MDKKVDVLGSGIYMIRCKPTGEFYIGCSVNIAQRWRGHMQSMSVSHYCLNEYMRAATKAYPDLADWEFIAVENVAENKIFAREAELIALLRPSLNSMLPNPKDLPHLSEDDLAWLKAKFYKPVGRACDVCGKPAKPTHKYCYQCGRDKLKEMKRAGYLACAPFTMPRLMEARENTTETKYGIDR